MSERLRTVDEQRGIGALKVQDHELKVRYYLLIRVGETQALSWGSDDWLAGVEHYEGRWHLVEADPTLDLVVGPVPARLEREDSTKPELSVWIDWETGPDSPGLYRGKFV